MQRQENGYAPGLHKRLGDQAMENEPLTSNEAQPAEDNARDEAGDAPADGEHRRKHKKVATRSGIATIMACHVLTVVLTVYLVRLSFKSHTLFSWHPACAAIGSLALSAQAVMVTSHHNVVVRALSRKARLRAHWILLTAASIFTLASLVAIVVNKNDRGKRHLASVHAVIGLLYTLLMVVANANGVAAHHAGKLKRFARPQATRLAHSVFGGVTFAAGVAALVSGLFTNFFRREAGPAGQAICAVALLLVCVLALRSPAKSAYVHYRKLNRSTHEEH